MRNCRWQVLASANALNQFAQKAYTHSTLCNSKEGDCTMNQIAQESPRNQSDVSQNGVRSFMIKESELDDVQRKIIQRKADSNQIISGCAGSGKTIIALWKAKELIETKHASVLIITYTKALVSFIETACQAIGIPGSSLRSLNNCYRWIKVFVDDDNFEWKKEGWKAGYYDYIIVDESQDLDKSQVQDIKQHCQYALFLGDDKQSIFDNKVSLLDIKNQLNTRIDTLLFNYRLPKKHAMFVDSLGCDSNLVDRCRNESDETPYLLKYNSFTDELDEIMRLVKNNHYQDVGILFDSRQKVSEAKLYFESKNFEVEVKTDGDFEMNFVSSKPKLMPYHSSKGLQFETVFLPECSSSSHLNALYVALTRSFKNLYIMYSDCLSPYLRNIDSERYKSSLVEKIWDI